MEDVHEIAHTYLQQLHEMLPSDDLVRASQGLYAHLVGLVDDALTSESYSRTHLARELQALTDLAHEKMRRASPTTLGEWRILYTDSCISHALSILDESTASRSIGLLDRAIIVAGGGDEGRLDLILTCITKIQQNLLPPPLPSRNLLNKNSHSSFNPLSTAHQEVPTIDSNLSFFSFQTVHSQGPFVIRGYAHDWPALKENKWNSVEYLLSVSGPSRVVPIEVGRDYRDDDWSQVLMDWESFLDAIADSSTSCKPGEVREVLYLAQHDILRQFPPLRHDIVVPDYIYCALRPQDFPGYRAPENTAGVILNVWLGPEGAASPAHFDPYYNIYVQVVGWKTVWLSPPKTRPYMEAYSTPKRSEDPQSASAGSVSCSNTSCIDVFGTERVVHNFPKFREKVVPEAMYVVLGPGDLLFFPPGWWHGMRSESTSFSISMWF